LCCYLPAQSSEIAGCYSHHIHSKATEPSSLWQSSFNSIGRISPFESSNQQQW
jgi:hypothetical protein